jgi:hypothetical protein
VQNTQRQLGRAGSLWPVARTGDDGWDLRVHSPVVRVRGGEDGGQLALVVAGAGLQHGAKRVGDLVRRDEILSV